jgi:hypothetical protein
VERRTGQSLNNGSRDGGIGHEIFGGFERFSKGDQKYTDMKEDNFLQTFEVKN